MKILKIFLLIVISLFLVILITIGLVYYYYIGRHPADNKKYPHYIGYLDPETTVSKDGFTLCEEKNPKYTHHGAPKRAYRINKKEFDKNIKSKYQNKGYTDYGYLNFRFIINCTGETGMFETIQMNMDMQEKQLQSEMVKHLFELTSASENWNIIKYKEEPVDYYMYVSYKIENGEITEILP